MNKDNGNIQLEHKGKLQVLSKWYNPVSDCGLHQNDDYKFPLKTRCILSQIYFDISNGPVNLNPSTNITQSILLYKITEKQSSLLAKLFNDKIDQKYFPSTVNYTTTIPLLKSGS